MTTTSAPPRPDDKLLARDIGELLGIKRTSWTSMVSKGIAPRCDGREALSGWPYWYRRTIEAFRASRGGRGVHVGPGPDLRRREHNPRPRRAG